MSSPVTVFVFLFWGQRHSLARSLVHLLVVAQGENRQGRQTFLFLVKVQVELFAFLHGVRV
jgi:hypothetical protein